MKSKGALALVLGVLVLAGLITLVPLWAPLLVAGWTAELARPVAHRLERLFGRRRIAAGITSALLIVVLVPLSLAIASLVVSGVDVWRRLSANPEARGALLSLVTDGSEQTLELFDPQHLVQVMREHGAVIWGIATTFAGATVTFLVAVFIYVVSTYAFLADGEGDWSWFVARMPLEPRILERLRSAFQETGRGIIIGNGLTALVQAALSGILFAAVGIPRALVLGEVTFFASFLPTLGTAAVWVPVSIGLVLSGQTASAAIVAGMGVGVIGTIDNVLRPSLAKWGKLELPVHLQILSVFGGLVVFGAWGFLMGPLLVRMAKEALNIAADEGLSR